MRRMTLSEMLTEFRYEARISPEPAHAVHLRERWEALLRRVQEEVWSAYEWPDLRVSRTVDLSPGQRYVQLPDQLSYDGITDARVLTPASDKWQPLTYGIEIEHLNEVDSDAGATRAKSTRWANYLSPDDEDLGGRMFEVWPVADVAQTIRFTGKRRLLPLFQQTDTSTVDGIVIVLHAAAEHLAAQKSEDATLKLQKAQLRYDHLKSGLTSPDNRRTFLSSRR